MKRSALGLAAFVVLAAACAPVSPPPAPPAVYQRSVPAVVVYGDSLVAQAASQLHAFVDARWGSAPCQLLPQMRADAKSHPKVVVVAFSGNYAPCGPNTHSQYLHDLVEARSIFPGARVLGVDPPPRLFINGISEAYHASGLELIDARTPFSDANGQWTPVNANGVQIRDADNTHLTPFGATIYASIVNAAL